MLSEEKNARLTSVGRGTPMGELLRRYWWPIAIESQLGVLPRRCRLLGEDLVLFRDGLGQLGLLEERCPHRRASLVYGSVEDAGLRCGYHGWLYDRSGQCLEQPAEPAGTSFHNRIKAEAFKVQALGGLIFAYLGPDPAPLLPRFDVFVWENVWRDIGHATLPCNWLQIMENNVDPHHVEWLHGAYGTFLRELVGKETPTVVSKRHVRVAFDPFEFGIIKRRLLEGQSEDAEDWTIGHPLVFPNMVRVGGGGLHFSQIRVPLDDTHTWHLWYQCYRSPDGTALPEQEDIPSYEVPIYDDNGEFVVDYIDGQDLMAWITQGAIADRTAEHLGKSDIGVITLRRMFDEQMAAVSEGRDPLGTVRDEKRNEIIRLPQEEAMFGSGADFRREFLTQGQTRYSPMKDDVLAMYRRFDDATSDTGT